MASDPFEAWIGDAFAIHRRTSSNTGNEIVDRVIGESFIESGSLGVVEEARDHLRQKGIKIAAAEETLERIGRLAEDNPHPMGGDDPTRVPGPEYFLPRVALAVVAHGLAFRGFAIASLEANAKGDWLDCLQMMRSTAFELGALCREYQLSRDNARDALQSKLRRRRSKEETARHSANRAATANHWKVVARTAAAEVWAKSPGLSVTAVARNVQKRLDRESVVSTTGKTPSERSIREVISDLKPKAGAD